MASFNNACIAILPVRELLSLLALVGFTRANPVKWGMKYSG